MVRDDVLALTERNEPEEGVWTKNNRQVLAESLVVRHLSVERLVFFATFLTEFDSGERSRDQVQVESHKRCDDEGENTCQDVRSHHEVGHFIVEAVRVAEGARYYWVARHTEQQTGNRTVEEHVHEEFVVVEADTVGNPRAVMVHLENASVALRTVMAPIWFRFVAPLTNAHAAVALPFN